VGALMIDVLEVRTTPIATKVPRSVAAAADYLDMVCCNLELRRSCREAHVWWCAAEGRCRSGGGWLAVGIVASMPLPTLGALYGC
jgi:hypothetical protein